MRAFAGAINSAVRAAFIIVWDCQNVAITKRGDNEAISGKYRDPFICPGEAVNFADR